MLKDKNGERLFRTVEMKIIFPDGIFPPRVIKSHAGPRMGINSDGIAEMQMKIADELDQLYPWWEFRMIELKPEGRTAKYNFVVAGYRAIPNIPTNKDAVALEPETAAVQPPTEVGNELAVPLSQE